METSNVYLAFAYFVWYDSNMNFHDLWTREHIQLRNRFSLVTIAIRMVSMSSEKVFFSLIVWLSLVELEVFYWIYGLWV